MTDFKHFKVLHKPSNKIVSIFQFTKDATWKGKEREELIAIPADTPKEVKEIEMCFTHEFKRYKGTEKEQYINAFFKRKPGQPETLSEKRGGGESEAHKLAKNEVYEKLYNGELTINGKTIYELGAKDLTISEEEYSDTGHSIADTFIHFGKYPNHHPLYNLGIDIEIQYSHQNEFRTKERTLSRLRDGWSPIWLWKEDFDENGKLKIKNLEVIPREKQLKELNEEEYECSVKKMNELGILIDDKIKLGKDEIIEYMINYKKLSNNLKEEIKELSNNLKNKVEQETESQITNLTKKTEELREEFLSKIKEEYSKCFKILEKTKEGIDYDELRKKLLSKLSEDEKLLNDFGDIFIRIKNEQLMKEIKNSLPLQIREYFLKQVDKIMIKIYEDGWGDVKKRVDSIKEKKDIYEPKDRWLVSKDTQIKLGDKNEKKDSQS